MPMTEIELQKRDAARDLGAELLESVREMEAGRAAKIHNVAVAPVVSARMKSGLSQSAFAKLLGVSIRTLQDWEQGRRTPSGAAKTLIASLNADRKCFEKLQFNIIFPTAAL